MKVFIRADASEGMGTGHIFRTSVLAKHIRSAGHEAIYVCRSLTQGLERKLKKDKFKVIPIPKKGQLDQEKEFIRQKVKKEKPRWMIVDHYEAKEDYYLFLKDLGLKVLAIDDINQTRFPVDVLLNQNINAKDYPYSCDLTTIKLLGPQYALVDDIYVQKREKAHVRKNLKNLLIFMGGVDASNQTLKVLRGAILSGRDFVIDIVLGADYEFKNMIQKETKNTHLKCRIHQELEHLADVMLKADLAVGAGGSASWEMATMRLPMMLMPVAENQLGIAKKIAYAGAGIFSGWYEETSELSIAGKLKNISDSDLQKMSIRAGEMCDGEGIKRILKTMYFISKK